MKFYAELINSSAARRPWVVEDVTHDHLITEGKYRPHYREEFERMVYNPAKAKIAEERSAATGGGGGGGGGGDDDDDIRAGEIADKIITHQPFKNAIDEAYNKVRRGEGVNPVSTSGDDDGGGGEEGEKSSSAKAAAETVTVRGKFGVSTQNVRTYRKWRREFGFRGERRGRHRFFVKLPPAPDIDIYRKLSTSIQNGKNIVYEATGEKWENNAGNF